MPQGVEAHIRQAGLMVIAEIRSTRMRHTTIIFGSKYLISPAFGSTRSSPITGIIRTGKEPSSSSPQHSAAKDDS